MAGFASVNDTPTDSPTGGRKFQGRVVDNLDPLMKQRIKVEIPNFMEGPPELLPWIGPLVQSKFGMTATAVSVNVPVIDSVIELEFQDGDLAYGVMTGSLHTEISAELGVLATNYPARRGWLDPKANWSYIDITPGQVEFQLHHYSGTQYTTFDDGRVHHLAVNLYFIEAPDIKEEAYNSHEVISTTSTHEASLSHTLRSPLVTTHCVTNTINAALTITHRALATAKLQSVVETEVSSVEHVLITAGRVDINP
jgi:hypothetical protein